MLYLLRHATSSWDNPVLTDADRPLSERGRRAAIAMGHRLEADGIRPDLIVCSPAARARETLELLRHCFAADTPVELDRRVYMASGDQLLARVRELPDEVNGAMIIGHNPGLQYFASLLASAASDASALARIRNKFPTTALAVFEIGLSRWAETASRCARLTRFILPRQR